MEFTIELTKNGKPNIVFEDRKYRESHTNKNGDIVWRCLGRVCGASIKTDDKRSVITILKRQHNGPHPVTMRSHSSPKQPQMLSASSPTSSPAAVPTDPCPSRASASPLSASVRVSVSPSPRPRPDWLAVDVIPASTPVQTDHTQSSGHLTPVEELEAENASLKDRVAELRQQMGCIINHTIENDARLLQFTNEIFSVNNSHSITPDNGSMVGPQWVECAVQCELPTNCIDERCAEDKTLIASLKTTIQVLEAEVECLRAEAKLCDCRSNGPWTECVTKNKYKQLNTCNETVEEGGIIHKKKNTSKPKRIKNSKETKKITKNYTKLKDGKINKGPLTLQGDKAKSQPRNDLHFSSVLIESDSHGRFVAGLVQEVLDTDGPRITGTCKPGAGLLQVTSSQPLPSDSCSVLIAGTNDVAAGQPKTIYQHLEPIIKSRLKTSKVVVATLPHRHDLPTRHPLNRDTALVNGYIQEVAARHAGIEILDFNRIPRRLFTSHGMHLRKPGKRMLAGLLLQCLRRVDQSASSRPTKTSPPLPPSAATTVSTDAACTSPAMEPLTLPYDNYAEAVKMPSTLARKAVGRATTEEDPSFLLLTKPVLSDP